MPSPTDPKDENFEGASALLDKGLKSCRAVVSGYRTLLAGDEDDDAGQADLPDMGAVVDESAT